MTLPGVDFTETDGGLGVLPPSAGRLVAFIGSATSGTKNQPATFARVKDLVATFTAGPVVEAAAHAISVTGKPVCVVRSDDSAGSVGSLTSVKTGTSTVTVHASPTPNDDYELVLKIIAGGTQGVAGITYQLSYDNGRTWSATTALGSATSVTFPGAGGVTFDIGAGTLVAGDTFSARSVAPAGDSTALTASLAALLVSAINWECVCVVSPLDSASVDALETAFAGLRASKRGYWLGGAPMPTDSQSEATYLSAEVTALGAKSTKTGGICAGSAKTTSGVTGRSYRRSPLFTVAARQAGIAPHVDAADPNLGALPGITLTDANGNPEDHDEALFPGLDDARFITLRSIDGIPGTFITQPRLFAPSGSDFQIIPHRRVANVAYEALYQYFVMRCNHPILVDKTTGFIAQQEATEIERGARNAMAAALLADPMASSVQFSLSRTDNVLSTRRLTGVARVVPLAYPTAFSIDFGYVNPAMQLAAAA